MLTGRPRTYAPNWRIDTVWPPRDHVGTPCRLERDSRRRWDDVPLPESLTKAHPEPLTIDGESETGSGRHCGQSTPAEMAMEPGASAGENSEAAFGLGLGSLMEAEPMTREEADAFDATPMDACFLELQMFSLSSMEPSQQTSNTASATSNPADSDPGRRGLKYGSRSTAEHTSSASNATNSLSHMVTQPGENNDSNRSSFETVDGQQQQHRASAAMQTSLYTNASQCMPTQQAYASAPGPDPWHASRRFDHTPAGASDRRHDGRHSNKQQDSQHQRDHGGSAASSMSCVPNARTVAQPHSRQVQLRFFMASVTLYATKRLTMPSVMIPFLSSAQQNSAQQGSNCALAISQGS